MIALRALGLLVSFKALIVPSCSSITSPMCLLFLAQAAGAPEQNPEAAVGLAERMTRGGPAVMAMTLAIFCVVALLLVVRSRLEKEKELTDLERTYRTDLDNRAKAQAADAEKRLADAKADAKDRAAEVDRLMRERFAVEKASSETLGHAVLAVENGAQIMADAKTRDERTLALLTDVKVVLERAVRALERAEDRR